MRQFGNENFVTYVIGLIAISLSLYSLVSYKHDLSIVAASIYLTIACYYDCRFNKIPNLLNAVLVISGITLNVYIAGLSGFYFSLTGLLLGLALLFLPYLVGGFGAGDVKALGGMGALLGPYALLHVFAYMALFGGGLALLYNLFNRQLWNKLNVGMNSVTATVLSRDINNLEAADDPIKTSLVRFPYVTAIAFGYYTFIYRGGIL